MTIEFAGLAPIEARVSDLERRVAAIEAGLPAGWRYYPPLNDTRNVVSRPARGGLDSVMADEGYVVK